MSSPNPRKIFIKRAIYLSVALLAIAATYLQLRYQKPDLPRFRQVPEFQLTERSGRTVTLADLKGKIWVADFIYTTCPGPCPMISSRLSQMQEQALANDAVRFVSISVNPEQDTPEVLREYAKQFEASPDRWLFLTGEKNAVRSLITNGFMLTALDQTGEGVEPVAHSTKLVLVDRKGRIRGFYDALDKAGTEKLLADLRRLTRD
jgi:protein SCO1